jgi:hypothetical protein
MRRFLLLRRDLLAVLRRAELPVDSPSVSASATVTGFPGDARLASIVVTPLVLGGDGSRHAKYEVAAGLAHERCLIGHALAPDVAYEIRSVRVRGDVALEPDAGAPWLREIPGRAEHGRGLAPVKHDVEIARPPTRRRVPLTSRASRSSVPPPHWGAVPSPISSRSPGSR